MEKAKFITYQSPINGIMMDVPEQEITNDFLNHPDKQTFLRPIDDVKTSDMGKGKGDTVPKRNANKAQPKAVVEVE